MDMGMILLLKTVDDCDEDEKEEDLNDDNNEMTMRIMMTASNIRLPVDFWP